MRRKSDHLKALSGTLEPGRTDPQPSPLPPVGSPPSPPVWMSTEGARQFTELAAIMARFPMLTPGHLPLLAQYCELGAALARTWASGSTPLAAHLSTYRNMSTALGLTGLPMIPQQAAPTSRNRFANNYRLSLVSGKPERCKI